MTQPLATYRVQLHKDFTFDDLRQQLPYLKAIGIDTIYASPILKARPGSMHGYDAIDVGVLNPELGTEADWQALCREVQRLGLRWLQDIVPNHMAVSPNNPWLVDVMRHGPDSPYARFFDIDWAHPEFENKMILPILGHTLSEALEQNHIQVVAEGQSYALQIYDQRWPLSDKSLALIDDLEPANQPDMLSVIVAQQYYRPSHWRMTDSRLNYRRFFTINELICMRVEEEAVVEASHAYLRQMLEEGMISGFRVDHIDGLLNPGAYLRKLRELAGSDAYIVVEKILEIGEKLPDSWPIQGTTGYDYMAAINRLLTADDNAEAFTELYREIIRGQEDEINYQRQVYNNKRYMLEEHFMGELSNIQRAWWDHLPEQVREDHFEEVLTAWLAAFPVYRIYTEEGPLSEQDQHYIREATERATTYEPERAEALQRWQDWLLDRGHWSGDALQALQRTQQLSGPLMAKGIEDTTFYRYWRQAHLNEVGSNADPDFRFGIDDFHRFVQARPATTMNATATHDTKRGEDARTILQAVSGYPDAWRQFVEEAAERMRTWARENPPAMGARELRAKDHYALLQTLVATYPLNAAPNDEQYAGRLSEYLIKALREGKRLSDWTEPNERYEGRWIAAGKYLLEDTSFNKTLQTLRQKIRGSAYRNSLLQTVLKCMIPGTPDIYQGTELWDLSLVDPDNRRPVDYHHRQAVLKAITADYAEHPRETLARLEQDLQKPDLKMLVLHRCLHARQTYAGLFLTGDYQPVTTAGSYGEVLLAFTRTSGRQRLLLLAPIHPARPGGWPCGEVWQDTSFNLAESGTYHNWLTGEQMTATAGQQSVSDWLSRFPIGIWIQDQGL